MKSGFEEVKSDKVVKYKVRTTFLTIYEAGQPVKMVRTTISKCTNGR